MNFKVKKAAPKPVMHMIVRGRRAYGEEWRKVTISHDDNDVFVAENEATEKPADENPIFVPAMGELSMDMADYLLEEQRKRSEDRAKRGLAEGLPTDEEINRMWQDYAEQRLRLFKGQTTLGPGGMSQREKPGITRWKGIQR